jgi:hypothetical protein
MRRSTIIAISCAVLAGIVVLAYSMAPDEAAAAASAPSDVALTTAAATTGAATGLAVGAQSPLSAEGQRNRAAQLALWQGRYERAEQVYANYRDATRYPHDSRPLAENPDQVRSFATITEDTKLRGPNGEPIKGLRLRTTQEKVFASGADSVKLTVQAIDDTGAPMQLTIASATAQSVAESKVLAQAINTKIMFTDDGQGADSAAGDGTYCTRLVPSVQGFASYACTVRVLTQLTANGQQGVAHFDVVYNPDNPATWAGVREAIEAGSLHFYFKVQVNQAGRYVASARVDDANGQPFALLQFNDEVPTGAREFKMKVFGALIHDKRPAFPLRVRDIECFLLFENRYPDRAVMPRQAGLVHTSGRYGIDNFAATEWTSEERERYLAEYARDAERARTEIARLSTR